MCFIYEIVELEEVQGQLRKKKTHNTQNTYTQTCNVARNTSVNLSRTSQYAQKLVTVQYMKFYQEKYIIKWVPTLRIRNMTINNVLFKLKHSNAKHSLSFLKHTFLLHTCRKAFPTLRYKLTPTLFLIFPFYQTLPTEYYSHMNDTYIQAFRSM